MATDRFQRKCIFDPNDVDTIWRCECRWCGMAAVLIGPRPNPPIKPKMVEVSLEDVRKVYG